MKQFCCLFVFLLSHHSLHDTEETGGHFLIHPTLTSRPLPHTVFLMNHEQNTQSRGASDGLSFLISMSFIGLYRYLFNS